MSFLGREVADQGGGGVGAGSGEGWQALLSIRIKP